MEYTTSTNDRDRPVMIHCAKLGSVERFIGVLVEHYAGAFPCWLAPVQATVVPVADRHNDYGAEVVAELRSAGIRADLDDHDDTVGEKIRRAVTRKHPAVLVVGDDDVEASSVGLRVDGEETRGVPRAEAIRRLVERCAPPR
ncbi:MAG: threonine--tRNA ligase, partial [Acidimicrobiia bacterium]|nr:threonine--tRNA ligase [Acidimicrobiia bacterium]